MNSRLHCEGARWGTQRRRGILGTCWTQRRRRRHTTDAGLRAAGRVGRTEPLERAHKTRAVSIESNGSTDVERYGSLSVEAEDGQAEESKPASKNEYLAAVDCGTHSFRLVVVRASPDGRFKVIDRHKEEVRLGSGSGGFQIITQDAEERAIAALRRLREIAESREAKLRVVATSALREARNRKAVLRTLQMQTQTSIEIISGQEEARLMYLGVLQALPVRNEGAVCIDIGGGSTELVLGYNGEPLFASSMKLGHIKLTEEKISQPGEDHTNGIPDIESRISELRRYIEVSMADSGVPEALLVTGQHNAQENGLKKAFDVSIGSSGTISTLYSIVGSARADPTAPLVAENGENVLDGGSFTRADLKVIIGRLTDMARESFPLKIPGVSEKRGETLLAGAVLLDEIFASLGIEELRLSPYALREGVIVDTLSRILPSFREAGNIRESSLLHLAQRFDSENRLGSAEHLADLAQQLAHGICHQGPDEPSVSPLFDDQCLELMRAACILHFTGMFLSHSGHHKHAYYIIKNNEHLMGYTPLEVEIIALLARFHRGKPPGKKKIEHLPSLWANRFRPMAAIVRMAVAFDRRNKGEVTGVSVLKSVDKCVLFLQSSDDANISLELWAARQELEFFSKIFGLETMIVEDSGGSDSEHDESVD